VKFFQAFTAELAKLAIGDISPGYELGGRTSTVVDTPRSEDRFPSKPPHFSKERLILRRKLANSILYS
jgi:hypothetical protein